LTHYRTRRLLGAYLDGALDERRAQAAAGHVEGCGRCRHEVEELRRLRMVMVSVATVSGAGVPDWAGFWPGVVRRIEDGRRRPPIEIPWRWRAVWRPRLAYGSAVAAAVVLSLTLWQAFWSTSPEVKVFVRSARTDLPGGSVMVYSPPERDMAVVWVFDGEN
jgi:anti-sigma factor RsiW